MQEASFQGVLRTILTIVLIYYGIKFIGKLLLPLFFQKVVNNFEKKVKKQQGYKETPNKTKEGETVIDRKPNEPKQSNKNVGEYVDFEEVDD